MLIVASFVYYYKKETNVYLRRMKRLENDNTPIMRPIRSKYESKYESSNFRSIILYPSEEREETMSL